MNILTKAERQAEKDWAERQKMLAESDTGPLPVVESKWELGPEECMDLPREYTAEDSCNDWIGGMNRRDI